MSNFFVGQRIKLVRSSYAGVTGCVHSFERSIGGYDIVVELEEAARCGRDEMAAGTLVDAFSWQWEPIIPDGDRPGYKGCCDLLDSLLDSEIGVLA